MRERGRNRRIESPGRPAIKGGGMGRRERGGGSPHFHIRLLRGRGRVPYRSSSKTTRPPTYERIYRQRKDKVVDERTRDDILLL
jgi:hypothetical protein